MYRFWVFVHMLGVAGFLLAHGVAAGVALKLRKERDALRVETLMSFSGASMNLFFVSVGVLLLGGIAAGFLGNWWGRWWIWVSLAIFIAVAVAMSVLIRPYFDRLGNAVDRALKGEPEETPGELERLLASRRLAAVSLIGFAALAVILFLMVFKP